MLWSWAMCHITAATMLADVRIDVLGWLEKHEKIAESQSIESATGARRGDIPGSVMTKVHAAIELLGSKPPRQDEARDVLKSIQSEAELLVEQGKGAVALQADIVAGAALYNKGHYAAALPFLAHAVLLDPKNELALELLISCDIERGEIVKAKRSLDYALKNVNPSSAAFHFLSGRVVFGESERDGDKGRLLEAIKEFQVALGLGFDDPDIARYWVARCYKQLSMPQKALKELATIDRSKLPVRYSSPFQWHLLLAALYAEAGELPLAIENELLATKEAASPRDLRLVWLALAAHHKDMGDHEKAVGFVNKVLQSRDAEPDTVVAAYALAANSYRELGELDLCVEYAAKVIASDVATVSYRQAAFYYAAQCYRDRGNTDKAREMLERAIAVDPDTQVARNAKKLLGELNLKREAGENRP